MLNGRNERQDDFTSVSTKCCAAVDYCLVSHDNLSSFSVTRAADLINQWNNIDGVAAFQTIQYWRGK